MRYMISVFLGACSYGVLSTLVKLSYQHGFTTSEIVSCQVFFGTLMIWTIVGSSKRLFCRAIPREANTPQPPAASRPTLKQHLLLMIIGSMSALTGVFYYLSLRYTDASIAVILLFQFTWIGIFISAVIERKRPSVLQMTSLIFLLLGTLLAGGLGAADLSAVPWYAFVLGLLAAVSYSIFVLFSGHHAGFLPPLLRSALMINGAFVLTLIIYPPRFLWDGAILHGLLIWGLPLAFFGILLPTLLFAIGVPHVGGAMSTILGAAELPTAVFLSAIVLREAVAPVQWMGVCLILLGIVLPEIRGTFHRRSQNK